MSILNTIVKAVVSVFKLIGRKPSWTDIVTNIVPQIFGMVDNAIAFGGYSTKEKFDEFLELIDLKTGVDAEALDILKDVTAEAEEEFFDGIVQAARAYGYAKLKVPGYAEGVATQ